MEKSITINHHSVDFYRFRRCPEVINGSEDARKNVLGKFFIICQRLINHGRTQKVSNCNVNWWFFIYKIYFSEHFFSVITAALCSSFVSLFSMLVNREEKVFAAFSGCGPKAFLINFSLMTFTSLLFFPFSVCCGKTFLWYRVLQTFVSWMSHGNPEFTFLNWKKTNSIFSR